MHAMRAIKLLASIVLMLSFFMPLTQCTHKAEPTTNHATIKKDEPLTAANAYEWPSIESFMVLFLFIWPLLSQVITTKMKLNPAQIYLIGVSESILAWLSISLILWFVLLWGNHIKYGSYVAISAILVYLIATISCGYQALKQSISRLNTNI